MTEREQLIAQVRDLQQRHLAKSAAWRLETGASEECGCVTREACQLVALLPRIRAMGLTLEEQGIEPSPLLGL